MGTRLPILRPDKNWLRAALVPLVALITIVSGAVNLYSALNPLPPARQKLLRQLLPLEFLHFPRSFTLLVGLALIVSAISVGQRKRRAFQIVLVLSIASVFVHLLKGHGYAQMAWSLFLAGLLLCTRRSFTVRSSLPDWGLIAARIGAAALAAFSYGVAGFGVIVVAAVAFFVFFAFCRREPSEEQALHRLPRWKPLRTFASLLERLGRGLRETSRTRAFYLSFALSLVLLLLQTEAYRLIMLGYGLHLSFWIGLTVFLIVHLGTAIPNAPANVGSYQFFTVVGLTLFGVDKTFATGFSVVVFVLLTLPLLAIGFIAFSRSGMTLAKVGNCS